MGKYVDINVNLCVENTEISGSRLLFLIIFNPNKLAVADLRATSYVCQSRSKFFHFHAVFGEIWPNNRLIPILLELAPTWEILDPPLLRERLLGKIARCLK